jgi:hypothetical protein
MAASALRRGAAAEGVRVLGEADVRGALTMEAAIAANAEAFRALAAGRAQVPERLAMAVPGAGATLVKPARTEAALGLKVVSVRERNAARGLPTVPATVVRRALARARARARALTARSCCWTPRRGCRCASWPPRTSRRCGECCLLPRRAAR